MVTRIAAICFINDKNKDVNACIRENGFTICHFLMKDIKEELSEYVDKHHLSERLLEIKLRRINRRKEILLSIVNSGLLQEDALALVSDFIAAFDVSAIANAAAEQQKKIDKGEGNDKIIPLSSCLNPVTPLHTASEIQYS